MVGAGVILCLVLLVLGALHLLWALGYWFPVRDEAQLARTVAGFPGISRMPGPVPCAVVAVILMMGAALPFWPHSALRSLGLVAMSAVFGLRGLAAFTPQWRKLAPEQPFATLDRRWYGPLCLALGVLSALAL